MKIFTQTGREFIVNNLRSDEPPTPVEVYRLKKNMGKGKHLRQDPPTIYDGTTRTARIFRLPGE